MHSQVELYQFPEDSEAFELDTFTIGLDHVKKTLTHLKVRYEARLPGDLSVEYYMRDVLPGSLAPLRDRH
jgi:hypothetical protein